MTDLDAIRREHGIRPAEPARRALRAAYEAGLRDAVQPTEPSRPGRRRYGCEPREAAVLAEIRTLRLLDGHDGRWTWQRIADRLNGLKHHQRNGKPWTASAVAGVVKAR